MAFLTKVIPFVSPLLQSKLWYDGLSVPSSSDKKNSDLESKLKQKFTPFFNQHGVRGDVAFRAIPNPTLCAARGTNCFTGLQAGIIVTPELHEADSEALSWTIKHEVAHIKGNDLFTMPLVAVIAALATAILLPTLIGYGLLASIGTYLVANLVSLVALSVFSRWREGVADDFANEHATVKELKGGVRLLQAVKELQTGFDFLHPSVASRIEKIEKELKKRGEAVQENAEHTALVSRLKEAIVGPQKTLAPGNTDAEPQPQPACAC